ncbi:MAG: hypothetical protein ACREQ5_22410, partial [Candidatus Dormibacteria bacterium]
LLPGPCGVTPEVVMPFCCLMVTDDLARWGSWGIPSICGVRPRGDPGATLDGTGARVVWLCPRAGVW